MPIGVAPVKSGRTGDDVWHGMTSWLDQIRRDHRPGAQRCSPPRLLAQLVQCAIIALAACGAGGAPARAAGFDLDFFKPTTPATGYFCEENGLTVGRGTLDTDVTGGYSHRPLVLRDQKTALTTGDVVRDRITGFVTVALGLTDRVDIGLRLAAVMQQLGTVAVDLTNDGGVPQHPRSSALGDTDLLLRVALLDVDHRYQGFRLTLTAPMGIPTGAADALSGSGKFSFRPSLTAGWHRVRLSGAASVGYAWRPGAEVPSSGLLVGNAVTAGAGVGYALIRDRLWIQAEASVSVGAVLSRTGAGTVATQLIAGPRALLPGHVMVQVGAGTGLNQSAGSPRFAALATVGRAWSIP